MDVSRKKPQVTRIAVVAMDNVLGSSLGITLDVLNTAADLMKSKGGAELSVQVFSLRRASQVRSSSGLQISGLVPRTDVKQPDVVMLPGCNVNDPEKLLQWLHDPEFEAVRDWLRRVAPQARMIASGCVGTFVMASTGLLDGRSATTTWWLAREFQRLYPKVTLNMTRMVVDEDKYLTAGAALAQADLALHVVRRLCGPKVARLSASFMLADERPSQAHFAISTFMAHPHPDIARAEKWIIQNLSRPFTVEELAKSVHLTPRTLARRFVEATGSTPYNFIQRIRVERAHHLVQTTSHPLQHIAEAVGYQDLSALRRVFKRFEYPSLSTLRRKKDAN